MKKYFRMIAAVLICLVAVSVTDVKAASYSDADVYLLAQLVYHEAHNQAYNGKVGIAEVVLNRLNSSLFPNSVEAVIGQKGQFLSVSRLRGVKPTDQEIRIAENVLNGSLRVFDDPNVMYFRNPKITSGFSSKVEKNWGNLDYATAIGDHAFYSQDMKTLKIAAAAEKEDEISNKLPTSVVASMFSAEKKDVVEKAEVVEVIAQAVADETVAEEVVAEENVAVVAEDAVAVADIVPSENFLAVANAVETEVAVEDDALLATDMDSTASNEELLALAQTMQVQLSLEDTLANEIETAVEVEAESEDDVTEVDAAATDETDTDVDTDVDEDLVADVVALAVDTDVALTEMVMPTYTLQMAASKVTDSEDADSEDADSDNEDDEDDEDEEIDENDPVARVHRQLKRDAKLKRKQDAKRAAEYTQAINAAHDLAVVNTKAAVERVENVLKAGQPLNIKTLAN